MGWSVSLVSAGITVFYLTAALALPLVGAAIDRRGSRSVIAGGAVLLALGVTAMGQVAAPWQLYAAFVCIGLGYATMSVIGLSATIAPWRRSSPAVGSVPRRARAPHKLAAS